MAKATYELPPDIAFRDAARAVMMAGYRKMMDNAAGTRAGLEQRDPTPEGIEALHDMRVGSRRLRAALSVFGKVFPKDEFRALDRQIGRITDALGMVRDLDVQLDYLRTLQATLPPNEAYGIGQLIKQQTKRRDTERKALIAALDRLEKDRFEQKFLKVVGKALGPMPGGESGSAGPTGTEA
jgi:CHAD domain-containing protein